MARESLMTYAAWLLAGLCVAAGVATGSLAGEPAAAESHTEARSVHALAMRGSPALPADFTALPYANPDAPKGGRLTLSLLGTFDSLNPFIVKGTAPTVLRSFVFEPLMARSFDEPFTLYPLLAQSLTTDEERTFVAFTLNPKATFSDGTPVTADDILFSFTTLRDKGRPNYRLYYNKIKSTQIIDRFTIRFTFSEPDRELPLIMGLMPVLSKANVDLARFEETSLTPPIGSGPYKIGPMEAGASLTLVRNPQYWGRDLPVNRGFFNFDELKYIYFRDSNSEFEAFKKGIIDARFETDPARWETGYDFPAERSGDVLRELIPTGTPKPYSALVFNTRRPIFADIRVRRALIELFDFEWLDRNFYHGLYRRTASFFEGSQLSALGQPANAGERAILAPFASTILPDVLEGSYRPPVSDGSGRDRERLRAALALFAEAGWGLQKGALLDGKGTPFAIEIMVVTRDQERLALAYAGQLKRAGINAQVRYVDAVQFDARRNAYDFDMVPFVWAQSLSPGNEQAFYFGSAAADTPGTRNYMGARNGAVDAAIAALLAARDTEDYVAAARALDRALISGAYAVPLFHTPGQWLARWTRIARPQALSLYGTLPETWWRKPDH